MRFSPLAVARPHSIQGIAVTVRSGASPIRAVGAGHSFTPLVATAGTLVSLEGFQGIESADARAGRALVRGGTPLERLGGELYALGLAQENLGDVDAQSLAGAISTGTHGTGIELGNLSTQVAGLTLVTATGEVVECSPDSEPELYQAARLSLGALGVIAKVDLRVRPAYSLGYRNERLELEQCLERLTELSTGSRHFEFFWFPHTRYVHAKTLSETTHPAPDKSWRKRADELLLENATFRVLSEIARLVPRTAPRISRLSIAGLRMTTGSGKSHHVFATKRLVRFHEMEYSVPVDRVPDVLRELRGWLEESGFPVHFPVECRFVAGDDIWLSPTYGRNSALIAVHAYHRMPYERYFRAAEAIFLRHEGRPHWGKMHSLTADELAPRYPRWDDFLRVRRRWDADGRFLNDHLRSLFGG